MCVYIYITDEGTSQIHTNPSVTGRKDRKTRDPDDPDDPEKRPQQLPSC